MTMSLLRSLVLLALLASPAQAVVLEAAPTYPSAVTPRGPKGDPGCSLLPTNGAPSANVGRDCDFALDVAAGKVYGPKIGGQWGPGVLMSPVAAAQALADRARFDREQARASKEDAAASATAASASQQAATTAASQAGASAASANAAKQAFDASFEGGVLSKNKGGAGDVAGVLQADGVGHVSAAATLGAGELLRKSVIPGDNVTWRGADPTGVVDASPYLLAALQNDDDILLPEGTFRVNSRVVASINKNIRLRGAGRGVTNLLCMDVAGCISLGMDSVLRQVHVSGMTFYAGNVGNNGPALSISYPSTASNPFAGASLYNLEFRGADHNQNYFSAALELSNAWNSNLIDVHINGKAAAPREAPVGIRLKCGSVAPHFSHFTIFWVDIAIWADDSSCDVSGQRIEGMYFSNFEMVGVGTGVLVEHPSPAPGSSIHDGHINAYACGICLTRQHQMSIHDMLIYHTDAATNWTGISLFSSEDNTIHNNRIFGPDVAGAGANNGIVLLGTSQQNKISDNQFKYFKVAGSAILVMNSADNNEIFRNRVIASPLFATLAFTTTGKANVARDNLPIAAPQSMAFPANAATPSVGNPISENFTTANTTPTTITNFMDAAEGQRITLLFNDANTTVQHNAGLLLKGGANASPPNGGIMSFVRWSATQWRETYRSF